jgi:hypothetical protein
LTIFCEKIGVFLKNQCYDQHFALFSFVLSQKRKFFAEFFGINILKIITSVPDWVKFRLMFSWVVFFDKLDHDIGLEEKVPFLSPKIGQNRRNYRL